MTKSDWDKLSIGDLLFCSICDQNHEIEDIAEDKECIECGECQGLVYLVDMGSLCWRDDQDEIQNVFPQNMHIQYTKLLDQLVEEIS